MPDWTDKYQHPIYSFDDDFEPEGLPDVDPRLVWLAIGICILLWVVIIAGVWGLWRAFHHVG